VEGLGQAVELAPQLAAISSIARPTGYSRDPAADQCKGEHQSYRRTFGHSSAAFTLEVYGDLLEETKREWAIKMDAALSRLPPALLPNLTWRE